MRSLAGSIGVLMVATALVTQCRPAKVELVSRLVPRDAARGQVVAVPPDARWAVVSPK